jgi:signal transduction histidine kinase
LHLVEKMGGSISVQSQEGQGSTFAVTLPAVAPAMPGA